MILTMVPEAPLRLTEHGRMAAGKGWFVLNMREARWWNRGHGLHCPPETQHAIVGAGDRPCVVLAVGARERHTFRAPDGRLQGRDDWGAYTVEKAALRHGAGVEKETNDAGEAYARLPEPQPMRYREGWLPDTHG